MSGTDQQATPTSSLASLPTPQSTPQPTPRRDEAKQPGADIGQVLQLLQGMSARLDRLEKSPAHAGPGADAGPGLADAVAEVASYRQGRPGGASSFAPRAPVGPPAGGSIKDQLRRRKTTPFPPRRQPLSFGDPYADRDSDDDDGAGRGTGDVDLTGDGRIAEVLMSNLRANYNSALDYVRSVDFSNTRAMHEARRTAQAIDALLREGVPLHFEGMEILVRNLTGVVEADKLGESAVLTGMEWQPPQDIVPRSVLRTVLKDAKRRKELKPKKTPKSEPASRDPKKGGQQGAGRQ